MVKVIRSKASKACLKKLGIAFIISIALGGVGFLFCKSEDTVKPRADSGGPDVVAGAKSETSSSGPEDTEWCELPPIDPKKDKETSIEDIHNITGCVRRLIAQVQALESKNN